MRTKFNSFLNRNRFWIDPLAVLVVILLQVYNIADRKNYQKLAAKERGKMLANDSLAAVQRKKIEKSVDVQFRRKLDQYNQEHGFKR